MVADNGKLPKLQIFLTVVFFFTQCTIVGAPPPVFVLLAKHPIVDKYNLTSLRMSLMGAAKISKETLEEVHKRIPTMTIFRQGRIQYEI